MPASTQDAPVSRFPDTRWTLVVSSRGSDTRSRRAMEELCRAYWYPLYAHARGRGCTAEDAEDLTQTLFSQMLARETMSRVSPDAGRLRSYLLTSLNNLITQDWRQRTAQKRGSGAPVIPLDQAAAEARYACDFATPATPEQEFNRRWALALLDRVMERLRAELAPVTSEAYSLWVQLLNGERALLSYHAASVILGLPEGTLRMKVFRLRKKYRALLREEIAHTVSHPAQVEEELGALFAAVAAAR
jgi:RNA polymerase sigma factor (sigma-70 family)